MTFGNNTVKKTLEPHCPLCEGTSVAFRYKDAALPIRWCSCGMVFLYPQPSDKQLREIYQSSYYLSWGIAGDDEEAPRAMKHHTFSRQLKTLARYVKPGKVLDVGCATGFFLDVASSAGWEVHGVELSEYAAEVARGRFGEHVFKGTLEQAGYPDESFDVVTLFDLLEHVPDPRLFLREVRRLLRPDGILLIVTPDITSLSARIMGHRWSHFKREHLHYFSPETITHLLTECGFALECREEAIKYLNFTYVVNQFRAYPHFIITPLCNVADSLLPTRIKKWHVPIRCGEMLILARKCMK